MEYTQNRKALGAAALTYLLFLIYAISTGLIGTLMAALLSGFGLDLAGGGSFTLAQYLGSGVAVLFSGSLLCKYRKWNIILVCYAVFAAGLCLIGTVGSLTYFLALLFVIGMATKLVDVTCNAVISQIFVKNKGLYMNLLHACFGIGNFVGPFLAERVLAAGLRWQTAFVIVGALAAAGLCLFLVRSRKLPDTTPDEGERLCVGRLLRCGDIWLLILTLVFYCGHQIGTSSWFVLYLTDVCGASAAAASLGMSLFWLGLLACRLACSGLSVKIPVKWLLLIGAAAGAAALAVGILIGSVAAATVGGLLAGLFAGATIPLCMTLGYEAHPKAQGTVSMLLFLSICAGQIIVPWGMGLVANGGGLTAAMWLNCVCLVLCAGTALLYVLRQRRTTPENGN